MAGSMTNVARHTIVDVVVRPFVGLLDVAFESVRQEVDVLVLVGQQVVEFMIEHADDLARLIADDALLLLVVEGRDGEATLVVLIDGEVDVAEMGEAVMERVGSDIFARRVLLVGSSETPSCWVSAQDSLDGLPRSPFSSISQCTDVNEMMSSRPLSFLTINVR